MKQMILLLAALTLACDSPTETTLTSIKTDLSEYALTAMTDASKQIGWTASIGITVQNTTGKWIVRPERLPGGFFKKVGSEWVLAYSWPVDDIFYAEDFAPGATSRFDIPVVAYNHDSNVYPQFLIDDPNGEYRIRIGGLWSNTFHLTRATSP